MLQALNFANKYDSYSLTLELLLQAYVDEPFTENLCQLTAEVFLCVVVLCAMEARDLISRNSSRACKIHACALLSVVEINTSKLRPRRECAFVFLLQAEQRRSCLERVADYVSGFNAQLFLQIISKQNSAVRISLRNKL
jgi:hypothetical protein